MPTTAKVPAFIVAPIEAMQLPLPFDGYMKPADQWADPNVPEYYSLAEIDGTDLLGYPVSIRKSIDGAWFIYSDSDFSYRLGHFQKLEDLAGQYGIPIYVLTTEKEVKAELAGYAADIGFEQIAQWEDNGGTS